MNLEIIAKQERLVGTVYLVKNEQDKYWLCSPPDYVVSPETSCSSEFVASAIAKYDFVLVPNAPFVLGYVDLQD